jgi:hypothetical protein
MKKTATTHLEPAESAHLIAVARDQQISVSAYLRNLVVDDMRRADAEALMALSIDALANAQHEHGRLLASMQTGLRMAFAQVSEQLATISEADARNAEAELQLRQSFLGSQADMAQLVERTMTECRDILDADNSILEAIERRLRTGER